MKRKKTIRWYQREENETQITTRVTYTDVTQKIMQAEELRQKKFIKLITESITSM